MRTQVIQPPYYPPVETQAISEILEKSLSRVDLNCNKDVILIIDDHTRPDTIQRMVFERLVQEVGYERVVVVIANGLHRASSYREIIESLGDGIKRARLYIHNPMQTSPSPFFTDRNIVIGINTVLPHLHTGFSNCGKLICPGLKPLNDAIAFHGMQSHIASLAIRTKTSLFDIGFDVYVNQFGDIVGCFEQDITYWVPKSFYYEVSFPELVDVAILSPSVKKSDFQQAMNTINIMKYNPLVHDGGTICIAGDTPDGMGVHYIFQQPNGIMPVKYDKAFGEFFKNKRISFIMPNVSGQSIQQYFNKPVDHYTSMDKFISVMEYIYGNNVSINIFKGADMMIGRTDEFISD